MVWRTGVHTCDRISICMVRWTVSWWMVLANFLWDSWMVDKMVRWLGWMDGGDESWMTDGIAGWCTE